MISRPGSDRIILFTLVDLLVQIIFFGFFLFAISKAHEGEVSAKLAALLNRVKLVSLVNFIDATSRLVPISDLSHVEVVGSGPSLNALDDLTELIKRLDQRSLKEVVSGGLSGKQLADLSVLFRGLSPGTQSRLLTLLKQFSAKGDKLVDALAVYRGLSPADLAKLTTLTREFASADAETRAKILSVAGTIALPLCFDGKRAMSIVSISSGFLVRVLPTVGSDIMSAQLAKFRTADNSSLSRYGLTGEYREIPMASFDNFGDAVMAQFSACQVRVDESSQTDRESQYKTIQRHFSTYRE